MCKGEADYGGEKMLKLWSSSKAASLPLPSKWGTPGKVTAPSLSFCSHIHSVLEFW